MACRTLTSVFYPLLSMRISVLINRESRDMCSRNVYRVHCSQHIGGLVLDLELYALEEAFSS